jgi:hypothetical protein
LKRRGGGGTRARARPQARGRLAVPRDFVTTGYGEDTQILRLQEALFTFVEVEGIEPTNNAAEHAIRKAVLWRKGSYGTQSLGGRRFVGRILSVVATLRQQGRKVLGYLVEACEARLFGEAAPSLLPAPVAQPL